MKIIFKYFIGLFFLLVALYFSGPRPRPPNLIKPFPQISATLDEISDWVDQKEKLYDNIKHDNESKIIFADSIRKKTKYSIVYLHGFSGSAEDGAPVHEQVAKALGFNLYLPRLFAHGLNESEPLLNYSGEKSLDSAREAIAIGKILGEKVILMGTSTGCTLALTLADDHDIAALVMYSPNIRITHPLDFIATTPWGLNLIRQIEGGNYHLMDDLNTNPYKTQYWTYRYRLEAVVEMQKLLETTMIPSTFNKVKVPVFSGFYYKNEIEQDLVVSVSAMKEMFQQLGTPKHLKEEKAFPNAGIHEIACWIVTKNHSEVREATLNFLNRVLETRQNKSVIH